MAIVVVPHDEEPNGDPGKGTGQGKEEPNGDPGKGTGQGKEEPNEDPGKQISYEQEGSSGAGAPVAGIGEEKYMMLENPDGTKTSLQDGFNTVHSGAECTRIEAPFGEQPKPDELAATSAKTNPEVGQTDNEVSTTTAGFNI